jgi:putative chitinase
VITLDDLKAICPQSNVGRLAVFVEPLNATFTEFQIDNPARETAFLAQVAHESGGFKYTRELWGPTPAQTGYEGRQDLGNIHEGDGKRFMGRGLIQITGRTNYYACGEALGLDLIDHPELLEEPINATRSAGWFWNWKHLSELADKGDFRGLTRRINGGYNGLPDRLAYLERAQGVLA